MTFTQNIVYWIYLRCGFKGGEVTLSFLLAPHWEAPYPFCPITYCALAGMGFVVFSGPLIRLSPARLWAWNSLEWKADYLSDCLFYSLFGIGIGRYLPPQIIKGAKYHLYQKI
jgi:hypothetical protein